MVDLKFRAIFKKPSEITASTKTVTNQDFLWKTSPDLIRLCRTYSPAWKRLEIHFQVKGLRCTCSHLQTLSGIRGKKSIQKGDEIFHIWNNFQPQFWGDFICSETYQVGWNKRSNITFLISSSIWDLFQSLAFSLNLDPPRSKDLGFDFFVVPGWLSWKLSHLCIYCNPCRKLSHLYIFCNLYQPTKYIDCPYQVQMRDPKQNLLRWCFQRVCYHLPVLQVLPWSFMDALLCESI